MIGNIFNSIKEYDIDYLKSNINKIDINQKDDIGLSLLHRAVQYGNCEAVDFLLNNGADINIRDNDYFTPLHSIIDGNETCWFDCIALLIEHGADVNTESIWQESNHKESPLIVAVKEDIYIEVLRLLLEQGADINYKDSYGDNAIRYAHDLYRDDEIIQLLEEYGAIYDGIETREKQINSF